MNCSVCGTMIPVGQNTCPNCGNPVQQAGGYQQPVQPMGGYQQPVQPMGGYQQPQQQMGGYQQPMGGYQQPQQQMGGYQQPQQQMGGYQQPMGGYQQPMGGYQQPMGGYQQPMGGYQQPMGGYRQPMGGGFNAFLATLKTDVMMIIRLVGALFLFIAPFFSWFALKIKYDGDSEKETANMFKLAGDGDIGVYAFFAIMLFVLAIVLVVWEIADYIPALANIKYKMQMVPYVDLIIVAVALLFVILAATNGMKGNMKDFKDSLDLYKDWYDAKGYCNHGVGPIIGFVGVACAAVPRILAVLNINVGNKRYM